MLSRAPVVGQWYSVVCPTCYSSVSFECLSTATYGIKCSSCGTMIDLRDPTDPMDPSDLGRPSEAMMSSCSRGSNNSNGCAEVLYSNEVEESDGLSAGAQVNILIKNIEQGKRAVMPEKMSGETSNAFAEKRNQAMSEKLSCLHPLTHMIERVVFGTKHDAKIGNVRIFRKWIPFKGYVNIPVCKTTTSYATPSLITGSLTVSHTWFCLTVSEDWLATNLAWTYFLVFFFYFFMYRLAYSDPGFIRPGYVDSDEAGDRIATAADMTLKDIESSQRESLWETVNGVPMERKWCSTCVMHRPPRAAHCYSCGLCCLDHDHHCNVTGVCVGRRRIEMFALFVCVTSAALLTPAFGTLGGLYWHRSDFSDNQFFAAVVHCIGLVMLCIPITMTAASMTQSILGEATTRERLQNVYANKRNPFDRGVWRNLRYHLFERKIQPTIFDDEFVKTCQLRFEQRELGKGKTVTCM